MKQFIGTILFVFVLQFAFANEQMQRANTLYSESKFEAAAEAYEQLAKTGLVSHELYFNLGNSYYRIEKYTKAVLNYERALLLESNDEATLANLEIAHNYVGDKVEAVPEFFLNQWYRTVFLSFSVDTWAFASIVFFFGVIAGLSFYFFSQNIAVRKLGFYLAIAALFFTGTCMWFGNEHHNYVVNHNYAIVYTSSLTVTSAPNDQGSELFVVHEGTKVRMMKKNGNWREVKLADGRVGWVKETDIIKI